MHAPINILVLSALLLAWDSKADNYKHFGGGHNMSSSDSKGSGLSAHPGFNLSYGYDFLVFEDAPHVIEDSPETPEDEGENTKNRNFKLEMGYKIRMR